MHACMHLLMDVCMCAVNNKTYYTPLMQPGGDFGSVQHGDWAALRNLCIEL